MSFRISRSAVSLIALCVSTVSIAGDEPIYEAAPDWIDPVNLSEVERDPANNQVVNDTQIRLQDGLHWEYKDIVYRVESLADLSNVGTLTAKWLPDKGDLIVHEIAILRGDEAIDLVGQDEKLEVLRRERMLERKILDGSLTATLAVPGLQVGDELRMRYSVTTSDQALRDEVQSQTFLWREPRKQADFGRIRTLWPTDLDVTYKAGPNFDLPAIIEEDGHNVLEVTLPLDEADDLPGRAPPRYRRGTILQVGTFADWAEVSSTMAPYYETDGALDGISDLIAKVEAIRTSNSTELERAVAALELVQEDVRYLLNGLDGGNYLPQDVATTWEKKYGDCKAKTVILLAILNHLGIKSEPVLASIRSGNNVPSSLPIPGAFDHVLVRAEIDGNQYYLDGTSIGANIKTVGNVPPFEYTLPIRAAGARLEKIEQVLPRYPEVQMEVFGDARAGGDLPALITITANLVGTPAAQTNARADKLTDAAKKNMGRGMGRQTGSDINVLDIEIIEGEDDSVSTVIMTGIASPMFRYKDGRFETTPSVLAKQISFSPDRSRKEWRQIPVWIGQPSSTAMKFRALLPDSPGDFELRGGEAIDVDVAGRRFTRNVVLAGDELLVEETIESRGGEIAPESFREERRKAARLARQEVKLIAPDELPRRWRYAQETDRNALEPLEAAFAQLIEDEPDEVAPYLSRAAFRFETYDFAGSLADMNTVVDLQATAENYRQRAGAFLKVLDQEAAKADMEEAYALDPTPARAIELADSMAYLGDLTGAREVLEYEDGNENVRRRLAFALAELDALEGDPDAGLDRLQALLDDKPNDSNILNEKCWFMGTWQINITDAVSVCTKAVENSGESANILDSRAMIYYRNGMLDEALVDINEALDRAPQLAPSVLLRGFIRKAQGDEGGQSDIDDALARRPELAAQYRRWGFDL
ncbi:DUF3857 domain-containing protein [Erythrobacter crassostreae]|uniref:DUF3857 domain-containing protein n=1 Tax=Erythrobacter crassostreae TaxID=2828328 RepID=A0A9X1F4X1_9SPHN|nr:DUF3857 domain-containing protein [Erythrobacter crassostrea]MBV7260159.1 DUF3857 domain-containing protein [Erythrobacter crassostrea]